MQPRLQVPMPHARNDRFHERILDGLHRAVGIPRGRSRTFYRVFFLGIVAVVSAVWAATFAVAGEFGWQFWLLAGLTCVAVVTSGDWREIVAVVLGFAALRFAVATVLNFRPIAPVLALAFGLAAFGVLMMKAKKP